MPTKTDIVLEDFIVNEMSVDEFERQKSNGELDQKQLYLVPDDFPQKVESLEQKVLGAEQGIGELEQSKQDIATAVNYDNITNCITHIPQDIKLELNNGALTLKAGSKVYVPNGVGVFDLITIQDDIATTVSYNGTCTLYYAPLAKACSLFNSQADMSGTTDPTITANFYNTEQNLIKRFNGSVLSYSGLSFPLCRCTTTTDGVSSIDVVFNGFGYIGSTIFALPGVKGLIPDGRNADGSLKNTEFVISNVQTYTQQYALISPHYIVLNANSIQEWDSVYWMGYNADKNIVYNKNGSASATIGEKLNVCICGVTEHIGTTKITSFTTKTAFHTVDYNDFETEISNAVHKTGAETISGVKTFSDGIVKTNTVLARREKDNSYLEWFGGTHYNKGAYFRANGKDLAEDPGHFIICANDGTTFRHLHGFVDGTLLWDNQRVLTSGSAYGCPNYSAVVQIWSGWTATSNGVVFGGASYGDDLNAKIVVNEKIVFWVSTSHGGTSYGNAVVSKGDVVKVEGGTYYFAPMK